jgi:hypothetical protein
LEEYIEFLRNIKEQSGWTTYQLDDSKIILWLVAPMLIGAILVTLATLFVKSDHVEAVASKVIATLVTVGFVGVLSYLTTNIQVHNHRQEKAVMEIVKNLSTDDYIELQKHVQLYGKKNIDDKELRNISKLLRKEFFPEKSYMNKGDWLK